MISPSAAATIRHSPSEVDLRVSWRLVVFALGVSPAAAQDAVPTAAPEAAVGQAPRLGRFRIGSIWLTPSLRIGQIGVDGNVFFAQTERKRDVTASGGPGLRMVLPLSRSLEVTADGNLNYLWYAEQSSERRLMGNISGRADWNGPSFGLGVETGVSRSFERIDFEVDQRVDQTSRNVEITNRIGRTDGGVVVTPSLALRRYEVADRANGNYPGVSSALSRDEMRLLVPLRFRLAPKTRFVLEGEYRTYNFAQDSWRDGNTYRLGAGFELVSTTRLSGRAMAGPSVFHPKQESLASFTSPWIALQVAYAVGPRTSVEARYTRDFGYSATSVSETEAPIRMNQQLIGSWSQRLVGRMGTRLWGGLSRFETRGEVLVPGAGGDVWRKRKDDVWQGGMDLTYELAPKFTVGIGGHYTDRRSNINAWGVEGLSFGVIVNYAGPVSVAFRP